MGWIGDVALAHKDLINAEKEYKHAILLNPDHTSAIYGLIGIYKHQSLKKALAYLESLPEERKLKFQNLRNNLHSALLQEQAEQLIKANQWTQAVEKYSQAQKIDPDNVWLIYHFALALHHVGETPKANKLFLQLVAKQKKNPEQIYAYALYLSNTDKMQQALKHLHTLPQKQWNMGMRQLAQSLTTELISHMHTIYVMVMINRLQHPI